MRLALWTTVENGRMQRGGVEVEVEVIKTLYSWIKLSKVE